MIDVVFAGLNISKCDQIQRIEHHSKSRPKEEQNEVLFWPSLHDLRAFRPLLVAELRRDRSRSHQQVALHASVASQVSFNNIEELNILRRWKLTQVDRPDSATSQATCKTSKVRRSALSAFTAARISSITLCSGAQECRPCNSTSTPLKPSASFRSA